MNYTDTCILVTEETTVNDYGTAVVEETSRKTVFCKMKSIGYKEAYEAMSVGHRPEICLILADYRDYGSERTVIYADVTYSVLRTYRTGKSIELTLERV